MKKQYTLLTVFACILGFSQINAQVSIRSENVLILNTTVVNAYDTMNPVLNMGSTGAGQNWDFSNVTEHETEKDSLRKPGGTFGENYFKSAGMAIDEGDSGYVYLTKNSTELVIVGFSELESSGDTSNQDLNMTIITFPSILGTKFTDDADEFRLAFEFNNDPDGPGPHPLVDSIGLVSSTRVGSEMDAEGDLKTKSGSYNALRQHFISYQTDSVFMHVNGKWVLLSPLMQNLTGSDSVTFDTLHTYRFWAEYVNVPIVEIEYDMVNGAVDEFQWLKEIKVGYGELAEESIDLKVYPNPVRNHLTIETELDEVNIEISDIQGRKIKSELISGNSRIDLGYLENGTYMLNIYNASGRFIQSKLIQVKH